MLSIIKIPIEQILGAPENRYFGSGFRSFNIDLKNLELYTREIKGQIKVNYNGPERPRGDEPHIGSIELIAFTSRISTYIINRLCRVNIADTDRAFITKYTLHIFRTMDEGTHNFSCKLLSTTPDNNCLQGYISLLEIRFENHALIKVEIDHRGYLMYKTLPLDQFIPFDLEQLHTIGYKSTELNFSPLEIDIDAKTIQTEFTYTNHFEENIFHGIGSARNSLLATDATRVFGQLMQALLYQLKNSDRIRCPNIWLRKMQLVQTRPTLKTNIKAHLLFENNREVFLNGKNWHLISLKGIVGSYTGYFEVAHKENKYE